jgi:hypothetical protein
MLKKLFALLLTLTLVLGLGTTALAAVASGDRVTDVLVPIDTYADNPTSFTPGNTAVFPLYADMFIWNSGTVPGKVPVTAEQLRGVSVDYRNVDSKVMKNPILTQRSVNGVSTMCVVVEFVSPFVSVDTVNFNCLIFLRVNNSRKTDSEIDFAGTFGNKLVSIDSSYDFYPMDEYTVIQATEYIKNIELDLDGGIILETRLFENVKYYGYAVDQMTNADDAMIDKYPDIVGIIRIYTAGISKSGKPLSVINYKDCYVYNKAGKYLGETSEMLEFADVLYISEKKIDMGGGAVSGDDDPPERENTGSTATTANNAVITTSNLTSLTKTAVSTAKSSGSKTATVRVKSAKSVSVEALEAMADTASASGLGAQLNADIMRGTAVSGRITINPFSVTGSKDIQLGVYVDDDYVGAVQSKFSRWYQNDVRVISLAHSGSYGMTVYISAKLSLSGFDTSDLNFYSYNPSTNKYQQLSGTNYKVDRNGYLQFQTTMGNMIVVSDGDLVRE